MGCDVARRGGCVASHDQPIANERFCKEAGGNNEEVQPAADSGPKLRRQYSAGWLSHLIAGETLYSAVPSVASGHRRATDPIGHPAVGWARDSADVGERGR